MFNSIWKQVVGDSDSSYSSSTENRDGTRAFSQRNNRSRGRNTATAAGGSGGGSHNSKDEDKMVEILLSQFPPYGTFSQNRRNQIFDSDDDDHHDNDDYKKSNKDERSINNNNDSMTVTDDEERSHHNRSSPSNSNTGSSIKQRRSRQQGRRTSTRTQRYNKVEEDDELRSVASYKSYTSTSIPRINTVTTNHGDDLSVININSDNHHHNNNDDDNHLHNEDTQESTTQTFFDWEDDDEMNLWHKKKGPNRKKRISSEKRKTRRRRKGKYKKHHEANIFFWEKRQEWVDQGPKGSLKVSSSKNTSKQIIDSISNTSYSSAPPSPGVTTASTSTQDTATSPKRKYSPKNLKNNNHMNDESTGSSLLSDSDYDSDSLSSDNSISAYRNDRFKQSAIFNQHSNNISQNAAESQSKGTTSTSIQMSKWSSKDYQHHYEEKQHWMPDKLCKQCYSCDVPFSVFRRRHHCRVCGQVFCSTCSAYFVEIGSTTAIDQQSQEKNDQNEKSLFLEKVASVKLGKTPSTAQSNISTTPSGKNNTDASKVASSSAASASKSTTSTLSVSTRTVRVCKMCNDQLSTGGGALLASQHQLQAEELQSGLSKDIRDTKGSSSRKLLSKLDAANDDEVAHRDSPLSASNHMKNFSSGKTTMSEKQTTPLQSNESSMSNLRNKFFPYKNSPLPSTTEETNAADPGSTKSKVQFSSTSDTVLTDSNITKQFAGHDGSGLDDDFHNLNMVKKKLDEERMKRELKEQEEAQAILAAKAEAEAELQKNQKQPLMIGKRISSTVSKRFGRLAEQAAREPQLGDGDFCDDEAKLVGTGVKIIEEEEEVYGLDTDTDEKITKNKTSFPYLTTDDELLNEHRRSPSNGQNDKTENDSVTQESSKKSNKIANSDALKQANMHLGKIAADHLERMGRELLQSEAPLLIKGKEDTKSLDRWVDKLMSLATKCCATVESNIREGDLLDIRPYCKIKVVPGGSLHDSVYMSGVIFHKNVTHKAMSKEIYNPRIMLLSGGIEYTRMENRIASLDTLLEQEEKYMEILVTKITKLKPDILIAGRSVSRKAQELLLKAKIVLIQRVKPALMKRIARQTGATILLSVDHVMNQFGSTILGKCNRFRLVAFRNNEKWKDRHDGTALESDQEDLNSDNEDIPDSVFYVDTLLSKKDIPNHKRQAVLAANSLGEKVHDGSDVIKSGLAKRGVTNTYVMIEGCPKHLGCTVVLRGANLSALKQVKRVFGFLVNVAYNLKLETSFLRDRRAKLPPDYTLPLSSIASSSLCIDYGSAPSGKRARPWNGGNNESKQRSLSGKITAFDHQSILITSVWMTGKTQCCPAEVKGICYYSQQDVSLGQFLRDSCFNLNLKCQNPSCTKSVIDHSLSFVHNDGLIRITVEQMEKPLPPGPGTSTEDSKSSGSSPEKNPAKTNTDSPIATWTYCNTCGKVVTPLIYISNETWKLSFGKFLEVFFYNKVALLNVPQHKCSCTVQTNSVLYFGCGDLAARFTYERIRPYGVYVRRFLPDNASYHRDQSFRQLESITPLSTDLFHRFNKHIQNISSDALQLFKFTVNNPEHVQTVVSELNFISSEVDHAANILQNKISSLTTRFQQLSLDDNFESNMTVYNDTLLQFPWHCRRYLFMLATAWNERLRAIGQALEPMKKLAASSQNSGNGGRGETNQNLSQTFVGDGNNDDFSAGMKRLHQLREVYSNFNLDEMIIHPFPMNTVDGERQGKTRKQKKVNESNVLDQDEHHYEDELNSDYGVQLDSDINFAEEIDADVLASRRRYAQKIESSSRRRSTVRIPDPRRLNDEFIEELSDSHQKRRRPASITRSDSGNSSQTNVMKAYEIGSIDTAFTKTPSSTPLQNKSKAVSAGGAVKSALNRFFNRGNKESDPYVVELGSFGTGRPKLDPGIDGSVIPVLDDKPSTIIAYSLSSREYDIHFKQFMKTDGLGHNETGQNNNSESVKKDDFIVESRNFDQIQQEKIIARRSIKIGGKRPSTTVATPLELRREIERQMLVRNKSHIKHTFRDFDDKGQQLCKFSCTTYWATQFQAVRQAFMSSSAFLDLKEAQAGNDASNALSAQEVEKSYIRSLMASNSWATSGGKSGASFARTEDKRFVVKSISRTELQMFLDCAPAYFEYLTKAFFHGLPTVLCKIVGVYQIGYHNRVTGKRTMEQVAVMQNIFLDRKISKVFDLKGSLRGRFTQQLKVEKEKKNADTSGSQSQSSNTVSKNQNSSRKVKKYESGSTDDDTSSDDEMEGNVYESENSSEGDSDVDESLLIDGKKNSQISDSVMPDVSKEPISSTLLDGDFLEFTGGRPLPLNDRAKAVFHMSILNDTLFLSIINVLDYSILIGIDEERKELVVGIIDFMRQYDILKQMERVGKSIPMVVGSEAPTIIQPPLYKARFTKAMEHYFMTVPSKWTII